MLKVIDLNAGLGGRIVAFINAGFTVENVYDADAENCDYLAKLVGVSKVKRTILEQLKSDSIKDVDVICAKYIQRKFRLVNARNRILVQNEANHRIYCIIKEKLPMYFFLEIPILELSHNAAEVEKYIQEFQELGYSFWNYTLDECECSGFPIKGRQAIFLGIRRDFEFVFQDFELSKIGSKNIMFEEANMIDPWYRKIFTDTKDMEKGKWYSKLKSDTSFTETQVINMGGGRVNCLVDLKGPRRFTHNELAFIKGLKYADFNACSNRLVMYSKIAYASNAYVAEKVVQCIVEAEEQLKKINKDKSTNERLSEKTSNEKSKAVFPKLTLKAISIEQLKCLHDVRIEFSKNLIAIMGVNGSGKTTILHALACTYSKYEKGENYKFSYFFTPNPDMSWNGTSISVTNYDEVTGEETIKNYRKKGARWARYNTRPIRDIYYFGIESCLPDIEKEKGTSFIGYNSISDDSKESRNIISSASYILQKNYAELIKNETKRKKYLGVGTSDGLKYSSLSMGAGEQRVFKLLQVLYEANQYSLILVDELDVLLHLDALKKLISIIADIAQRKHLQIIFTTHSVEMQKFQDKVDIKYIEHIGGNVVIYESIKPDLLYELSGEMPKEYIIYVEDDFAEASVRRVLKDVGMQSKVSIIPYGAVDNAATMAAARVIDGSNVDNCLVVMDGDKYTSDEEKKALLKKKWTGTENDREQKLDKALSMIKQFNLPDNTPPEEYIHSLLIEGEPENEIVSCAKRIRAVNDSHDWIREIEKLVGDVKETYWTIFEIVSKNAKWEEYIKDIKEWLVEKKAKDT